MAPQDPTRQRHAARLAPLRMTMAGLIERWTGGREDYTTAIPNLALFRRDAPTRPCTCRVEPGVVLVVQGAKQLLVGERACAYDENHFLVNTLDIPASTQTLDASFAKPCLGLVLKFDFRVIAELVTQSAPPPLVRGTDDSSTVLGAVTPALLEPFGRLLALLDEPAAIPVLAPLIVREIHYRLLMSEQGARLWQITSAGSLSQRVARAIDWLRANYAQPLRIEDLAAHVQMSQSTLHQHFRQLTAMSPLQYQKWLRLHEARHLMLNGRFDAAQAAYQVGYESPSQFSREYSRLFGAPPKRDIEGLRRQQADTSPDLSPREQWIDASMTAST